MFWDSLKKSLIIAVQVYDGMVVYGGSKGFLAARARAIYTRHY